MHICFYIHPFRDRDFWPIARTALAAGHDICYEYAGRVPVKDLLAEDQRRPFDLLISADRVSVDEAGGYLHAHFRKRPPLLEMIFNGLIEIAGNHRGPNGDFKHLEEHRVTLGVMDPMLVGACRSVGVQRVLYFPYGVPRFRFVQPDFFYRRRARRTLGAITAAEVRSADPLRLAGQAVHYLSGNPTKLRFLDIVFLGECNLGTNPALLESIRSRYFPRLSFDWIADLDKRVRTELGSGALKSPEDMTTLMESQLNAMDDDAETRVGKALLTEHYVHQFRTARRLEYLRRLQAAFGQRLFLYGDDFRRLGLDARPSSYEKTERKYLRAKIAIDFGSNSYETTLYTRSVRAIFCDAVLLQLKQPDAEEILGTTASDLTFSSPGEMVAQVSSVLRSRERQDSIRSALGALSSSKAGMDRALAAVLASLGCDAI